MPGYWKDVPRGVWQISSPIDAINCINDRETRCVEDVSKRRLYAYGPPKSAVWIDMPKLVKSCSDRELTRLTAALDKLGITGYI